MTITYTVYKREVLTDEQLFARCKQLNVSAPYDVNIGATFFACVFDDRKDAETLDNYAEIIVPLSAVQTILSHHNAVDNDDWAQAIDTLRKAAAQ